MNEYYSQLPKKWMGAGALFFNDEGKFLIVKPSYRDFWEIPGGNIGMGESPLQALKREVKEELDLDISAADLLCVEYHSDTDELGDRIHWIFDGGVLTPQLISSMRFADAEITEHAFVTLGEALPLLGENLHKRIPAALQGRSEGRTVYLEIL